LRYNKNATACLSFTVGYVKLKAVFIYQFVNKRGVFAYCDKQVMF